jgi:hypothetical protein
VDSHDREQPGAPSAPDEDLLVVQLLEIALDRRPAAQWPLPDALPVPVPAEPELVPEPEVVVEEPELTEPVVVPEVVLDRAPLTVVVGVVVPPEPLVVLDDGLVVDDVGPDPLAAPVVLVSDVLPVPATPPDPLGGLSSWPCVMLPLSCGS